MIPSSPPSNLSVPVSVVSQLLSEAHPRLVRLAVPWLERCFSQVALLPAPGFSDTLTSGLGLVLECTHGFSALTLHLLVKEAPPRIDGLALPRLAVPKLVKQALPWLVSEALTRPVGIALG